MICVSVRLGLLTNSFSECYRSRSMSFFEMKTSIGAGGEID